MLNVAYFGSPSFSSYLLRDLLISKTSEYLKIQLIVTQPDKPAGRGLELHKTPVKLLAEQYSLPVYDRPIRESLNELKSAMKMKSIDLAIVFAFNEILPQDILELTREGFWNIHPSLLPTYRGPSPIIFPLILGDTHTGVSLMKMNERMDEGLIIDQTNYEILESDTQETLIGTLTNQAYSLLEHHLSSIDSIAPEPQIGSATYTRKLTRHDGFVHKEVLQALIAGSSVEKSAFLPISWYLKRNNINEDHEEASILTLFHMWRGLTPWPGIWTTVSIKEKETRVKIVEMKKETTGKIYISLLQVEGRNPISLTEFRHIYPDAL